MSRPEHEQIWSVQEAINKAIATDKPVRFVSNKTNDELRKEIVDLKGCQLVKPDKDSNEVAAVPPSVKNFDFDAVDTSAVLWTPRGGIIR